jgi:hypothetical protein
MMLLRQRALLFAARLFLLAHSQAHTAQVMKSHHDPSGSKCALPGSQFAFAPPYLGIQKKKKKKPRTNPLIWPCLVYSSLPTVCTMMMNTQQHKLIYWARLQPPQKLIPKDCDNEPCTYS